MPKKTWSAEDIRLNLGCGLNAPTGWINIDSSPSLTLGRIPAAKIILRGVGIIGPEHLVKWPKNIRKLNVTRPLPFDNASVAAIYSSHMLEHLYHDQACRLLVECRRVLRRGGVLRLALPDAQAIARKLVESDSHAKTAAVEFNRDLHMGPLVRPTRRQRLVSRFSGSIHRWQPTTSLVIDMLWQAGFADPQPQTFLSGGLPGLADVEHRCESFFVEAVA